jgi:hypothetical protein
MVWLLTSRTQLEPELLKLKESFENTYDRALELSKDDSKYDVLWHYPLKMKHALTLLSYWSKDQNISNK